MPKANNTELKDCLSRVESGVYDLLTALERGLSTQQIQDALARTIVFSRVGGMTGDLIEVARLRAVAKANLFHAENQVKENKE